MYNKVLPLTYVDALLDNVRNAFTTTFAVELKDTKELHTFDFLAAYRQISSEVEQAALQV